MRRSLAGLQQEILREYRNRYNAMVESGQVAQDATEVAGVVLDQWLRYVMPGIQLAETVAGTGEELYTGPHVFHPGSGPPW